MRDQRRYITHGQIKKIHTLKNRLSMSEENYRDNLFYFFGVITLNALDTLQADEYIEKLEHDEISRQTVIADYWQYEDLVEEKNYRFQQLVFNLS